MASRRYLSPIDDDCDPTSHPAVGFFRRPLKMTHKINVLLVAEGDSWGGIESHIISLTDHYNSNKLINFECLLFYDSDFYNALTARGIKVSKILKNKYCLVKTIFKIRNFLNINSIDIIHTHSLVAAFYMSLSILFKNNISIINTLHGKAEKTGGLRSLKESISRMIVYSTIRYKRDAKMICVSSDLYEWSRKILKIPLNKLKIINNGISINDCKINKVKRENYGVLKNDFVAAIIGRLTEVKGHIYLFEAVRNLLKDYNKNNKFKLLVIGDGPLYNDLNEYCIENNITKTIIMMGHIHNAIDMISICDIIIIPSLHEGIPYSMLEGMLLEKPILASNVGGIKEVIINNYNGILVPPKDSNIIKDKIIELMETPEIRRIIAANGKNTVMNRFLSDGMAKETIQAYQQLLTRS